MNEEVIIRHLLAGSLKEKICRICFSEDDDLQPVLGSVDNVSTVKDMLLCISSVEVEEDDKMPENICKTCLEKVYNSYNFRIQCEDAHTLLNNCISCFYQQVENISHNDNLNCEETILIILPEDKCGTEIKQETDECFPNSSPKEDIPLKSEVNCTKAQSFNFDDLNLEPKPNFLSPVEDRNGKILKTLLEAVANEKKSEFSKALKFEDETKKIIFDCTICLESFYSKLELQRHQKSHPGNSRHICKVCYKSYRKLSILKRHSVTHSGSKHFKCYECGKSFFHRNALRSHTRYHQDKKYACKLCQTKFYFRFMLIEHLNENHSEEYAKSGDDLMLIGSIVKEEIISDNENATVKIEYDCTMCTKTFYSEIDLNAHKLLHPEGTRHLCRICEKSYLEVGTLNRHMIQHTGKKMHLCTVCGKSFYYRNVLKAHMVYHGEKKYDCQLCEKKFHKTHILREHVRLTHSDDKYTYMCEICGKLCSSRSRLIIHRNGHSKISCTQCGKSYKNMRYFKDHMKKHKGTVVKKKQFICDYCGETRSLKTLLELHILSKHLNERRYACNICGKGFFSKGSLNEHGVVHTKERPEECNVCGRRLINKKALVLHQRLHTGEKPFPCTICGERFLSTSRRLVHVKSKHSERTEHCHICQAKFHLRSDLNKHYAVHTKEKKSKIEEVFSIIT